MDKKKNEFDIFNLVYDRKEYDEIIASECPDFKIKNKFGNTYFGVEITEFYYTESDARIKKIPNYFTKTVHSLKNLDKSRIL